MRILLLLGVAILVVPILFKIAAFVLGNRSRVDLDPVVNNGMFLLIVFFVTIWAVELTLTYRVRKQPVLPWIERVIDSRSSFVFDSTTMGPFLAQGMLLRRLLEHPALLENLGIRANVPILGIWPAERWSVGITVVKLVILTPTSLLVIGLTAGQEPYCHFDLGQIQDLRFSRPWRWLAFVLGPLVNQVVFYTGTRQHRFRFELEDFCSFRRTLTQRS